MQLLPSPKAAVAEPISKHCCLVNSWSRRTPLTKQQCLVTAAWTWQQLLLCNCCQVQSLAAVAEPIAIG